MGNEKDDFANMKCPAVQEIDERNMPDNQVSNGEMDNSNERYKQGMLAEEEGSMVSNLPLLFANGYPTSLEKITMAQLERFILFMVHCSLGHDTTKVINKPEWWPQDVTFSSPLTRPKKINENWMANLKKLVFRCYTYHRSEYLLRFCSYLAQYPREELEYVNNWDSTTSLYHKNTGKLLVTFRNENMYYDRKVDNARRTLLSRASSVGNKAKQQQQVSMMVEPPCDDIYLCDNCDAEFIGLAKMKEHEKICCAEQDQGGSGSRSSSPDLTSISQVELQQDQFLSYFKLFSNKTEEAQSSDANTANVPDNNIVRRTSQRVRNTVSFTRCATIPFSSPAGMVLAKRSKSIITEDTQQERLDRIERHVVAPVLSPSCRPKWLDTVNCTKWIVTYKPNRDISNNSYVHQYKFGNSLKDKPILDIRSQLLYIACRPIHAVLKRLNEMQIDELKKDPSKYQRFHQRYVNAPKIRPRKAGPACRTRPKSRTVCGQTTLVSSKRRTECSDESGSSVSEDRDDTASDAKALVASPGVSLSPNNVKATETTTEKNCSPRAIMLIDLCSSDEEDDLRKAASCDENRDPLNTTGSSNAKPGLQKLSPKQTLSGNIHLCVSAKF